MYWSLLRFEWQFLLRKKALYGILLFFLLAGWGIGMAAHFPFPNTHPNGSWVLFYISGVVSLIAIFSTTILSALTLFRESVSGFDGILYATPLRKLPYVASRFSIIFSVSLAGYLLFYAGLAAGQWMQSIGHPGFGPFEGRFYAWPFLVLLLPDILFCTALSCAIGMLGRNRMLLYVSGVLLYFLYWALAMLLDSPLIANSEPLAEGALKWPALLDPFGISAFLEQSRHWTSAQRNHSLPALNSLLGWNRLLYILLSFLLLLLSYRLFRFVTVTATTKDTAAPAPQVKPRPWNPASVLTTGMGYTLRSACTVFRIEWRQISRSPVFRFALLGWMAYLAIETASNIGGNARQPPSLATTGIMVEAILESLPVFAVLLLLFYSSEAAWRNRSHRFDALELATPVSRMALLTGRWLALVALLTALIAVSVLTTIALQWYNGYTNPNWLLYASLVALLLWPLAIFSLLVLLLQTVIRNRWLALTAAALVLLLSQTSLGSQLSGNNPLFRFAVVFKGPYSEMAGFGPALQGFVYQSIFSTLICAFLVLLYARPAGKTARWIWLLPLAGMAAMGLWLLSLAQPESRSSVLDKQQRFEQYFSFLRNRPQPTVKYIRSKVDLYPSRYRYEVKGDYSMYNESGQPLDTVYMYGSPEMQWAHWFLEGGRLLGIEQDYYVFLLNKTLNPGDSCRLEFQFSYATSPFKTHAGANSIQRDGSFIRISNYFPLPGFNEDMLIDDPLERKRRDLPPLPPPAPPTAPRERQSFVQWEMQFTTDAGQMALGTGNLDSNWTSNNRYHARYSSDRPLPFRFAVASARYAVKRKKLRDKELEIYYHPGHAENIERFETAAATALQYGVEHFASYPFQKLCLAEISGLSSGFAGTAYPGTLFIHENFGFRSKMDVRPNRDIINEMVSHEVSHQWWGTASLAPGQRAGALLLTESLAMYSELMLYKKAYGDSVLPARVAVHRDLYFSDRSMAGEEPLVSMAPGKPWLAYNKGMVVMYQLYKLLGEDRMNTALKNLYNQHVYPNKQPISLDLLENLRAVATATEYAMIREWLEEIVTWDFEWQQCRIQKDDEHKYLLQVSALARKYLEDGRGGESLLPANGMLDVLITFRDGSRLRTNTPIQNDRVNLLLHCRQQPSGVQLDPDGLLLVRSDENTVRIPEQD